MIPRYTKDQDLVNQEDDDRQLAGYSTLAGCRTWPAGGLAGCFLAGWRLCRLRPAGWPSASRIACEEKSTTASHRTHADANQENLHNIYCPTCPFHRGQLGDRKSVV